MTEADRKSILAFIEAANDVLTLFERKIEKGKQQVPVTADEVQRLLAVEVRPEAWMHFGAMMASTEDKTNGTNH